MSDSDLSSILSSPPSSDNERPIIPTKSKQRPRASPPPDSDEMPPATESPVRKKRAPSPPHEEVLADNPDIAFIVMFRSRFSDTFPTKLVQFGPQDIERGVVDTSPSPQVESLLCALLGLVLNRQKPVEQGHYGRALEEAISKFKTEWPTAWKSKNPLSGGGSFENMTPVERLTLLKALILWALHSSDAITNIIKESYKQSRHNDDLNQPLSVQPWGKDAQNRQYWLIEGRDDTSFRLYREGNRKNVNIPWRSEAGTIDELKTVAQKLVDEGGQASRRLSERILNAIPRFEATEEKRKRREYRQSRKAAFQRPLDYGLYEGRTRGKRLRYTYDEEDDEEEDASDATDIRRSARHSGRGTPADTGRHTVTASGRQVRSRVGGLYGESLLSGQTTGHDTPMTGEYERSEMSEEPVTNGRATRSLRQAGPSNPRKRKHIDRYNSVDEMDEEDDAESSGADWENPDGDDERGEDVVDNEEDDDMDEEESEDEGPRSLIVKLKLSPSKLANGTSNSSQGESIVDSGASTAGHPTTSPSTAPSVNGISGLPIQNDVSIAERLVPQTTKPLFSLSQNQAQPSIASFFPPKPLSTG